ncbi:glycosyltransferase family 2 protein [Sphingobacterium ginsenosidimutans]|uniref:Glycosyltransferase family 2 protein n=1 Tax=Sphingobacterium ginsenosidimutans TaxID=687845 RepID=A0ABP7ZVT1_9SPHI
MNSLPLVSIIVPVYNAAATLDRTLSSLQAQTYQSIELIFVNDASTDDSLSKLMEFTDAVLKDSRLKTMVISHPENRGVANARNTALNHATGEFIMYVDADDTIQPEAVASCVKEAQQSGADLVYFHWWLSFHKNGRKMTQPACSTPLEAIQAMMAGKMRWNLWLFMVRRSLYDEHLIRFIPDANMGEDLTVMMKLMVHAQKIVLLDKVFYHYRQDNTTSISKTFSEKHKQEVEMNIKETESYLKASAYADKIGSGVDFLKLNIKLPLLVTGHKADYILWTNWFKSSNPYILKNVSVSLRTRMLQWLAWKKQFWAVRLYNAIVLRMIYGLIYK